MDRLLKIMLAACLFSTTCLLHAGEGGAKIIKMLPHYLDQKGRQSLSPSLYERDAYQKVLRDNPSLRSGIQFDIQWRARTSENMPLKLRLELRTSKTLDSKPIVLEQPVKQNGWFSTWSAITVTGGQYEGLGEVVAWRATLWKAEREIAELRSFLW